MESSSNLICQNTKKGCSKRPRFDPVPQSGEDNGPGRSYRQGTSWRYYKKDNSYNYKGNMEPIEK